MDDDHVSWCKCLNNYMAGNFQLAIPRANVCAVITRGQHKQAFKKFWPLQQLVAIELDKILNNSGEGLLELLIRF